MTSDQQYFRPRTDPRIYEEAMARATYLIDNGFIRLSDGVTYEQIVHNLIIIQQNKEKIE